MVRSASPTLVVFTLGSRADARRHPLLGPSGHGLEVGLRRACLESAFAAGRAAKMQIVVCSPEPLAETPRDVGWLPQQQGTFAERFEAAIEQGVLDSTQPLVIVGGDVPGLDAGLLAEALERLARDPEAVVVGPARDGGFYLLATSRPLGTLLREVRWCGRQTRKTLLAALARAGRRVVLLPSLCDLDRPADIEGWLADRRHRPGPLGLWSKRLLRFLGERLRPLASPPPCLLAVVPRAFVLGRAPPVTRAA